MVGLNLFARVRARSRSANSATENQLLADEKESRSSSNAVTNKRLDAVPDDDDTENVNPQLPNQHKRQKTASTTLMSSFSSNLLKKITFGKTKSAEDSSPEVDGDDDGRSGLSIVERYPDGSYVATKYGTAIVLQYRDADRMYVVRTVYNAVAFFHATCVVREVKCMVGDRVKTKWGMATVEHYYVDDDKYSIALDWRWDDDHVWRMKATTKMFDIPTPASATLASRATAARELVSKTIGDSYSSTALRMSSVSSWRPSPASYVSIMRLNSVKAAAAAVPPPPVWSPMFGEGRLERVLDGVARVHFVRSGAVGYLQQGSYSPLDFGTGDLLATVFGPGRVVHVAQSMCDNVPVYHIHLTSQNAMLYAVYPPVLVKKASPLATSSYSFTLPKFHLPSMPQAPSLMPSKQPPRHAKYMVGDVLRSPVFGPATIVAISTLSQMPTTFPEGVGSNRRTAAAVAYSSLMEKTKQAVISSSSMLSSANGVLKAQALSVKSSFDDLVKKGYSVDQRVMCPPFGSGFVTAVRDDGVYIVRLRKLKITAFFTEDALKLFPYDRATHVIVGENVRPVPMELYQATNKISRSAIIRESMASQHMHASLK
ncbi:hypothetical protein DYB26_008222 [Aphanomyces astaci]|uniref:Uncharacterized protein n=1 Tax=Aphanomyces astaci TaxID=112090 RepID=A0A3R7BEP2_APHAT|nr:hypothetical protein DYB26_008222 [Aphanomyces astaci]